MSVPLTGTLAQALASNRSRFNSKFAAARRYYPKLDADNFGEVLTTLVAPLVEAVAQADSSATEAVAEALYDISLNLVAQEFLGPTSRYPYLIEGWRVLLPRLARFIARDPRQFVGSVTNALYNLSATPGARPHEWAGQMLALADLAPDPDTLLQMGQILAWRAGLAHYRPSALDLARTLEPRLARAALGLPKDSPPIQTIIKDLLADPWLPPAYADGKRSKNLELKIVARVGAFRGFGGLFLAPPTVACSDGEFHVSDNDKQWRLTADLFGATFHRAETMPRATGLKGSPFKLNEGGTVSHGKYTRVFSELESFKSAAYNATTLAVTVSLSNAVYLVALVEL